MKKYIVFLLIISLLTAFSACGEKESEETKKSVSEISGGVSGNEDQPTGGDDNVREDEASESAAATGDAQKSEPTSEAAPAASAGLKTVTKADERVRLTVTFPETIRKGENFVLTAKAENISGKTLWYFVPTGTPDMHKEIRIEFPEKRFSGFTDLDTLDKIMNEVVMIPSLESGESFTEKINFAPGSMNSPYSGGGKDGKDYFGEPGEYGAKAVLTYLYSSPDDLDERVELSADLVFRIVA